MILSMMILTMIITSMSPLKASLAISMMSLSWGFMLLYLYSSSLPMAMVVISFSSGMMILFCYCSMMCNFQTMKKSFNKESMIMMVLVLSMIPMSSKTSNITNNEQMSMMIFSPMMLSCMGLVIITMMAINKGMYNPFKSMMESYYMM